MLLLTKSGWNCALNKIFWPDLRQNKYHIPEFDKVYPSSKAQAKSLEKSIIYTFFLLETYRRNPLDMLFKIYRSKLVNIKEEYQKNAHTESQAGSVSQNYTVSISCKTCLVFHNIFKDYRT